MPRQHTRLLARCSHSHHHRLCGGCGAVIHRCVGTVHTRQCGNHALKFKDVAQCALRNLRLIGRVCCQILRTARQRRHDSRSIVVVGTAASHYCQMSVFPVELLKTTAHLHFRHSVGQVVVAIEDDAARHVGIQVVEPVNADALQHLAYVGSSMRKIRKSHSHKS